MVNRLESPVDSEERRVEEEYTMNREAYEWVAGHSMNKTPKMVFSKPRMGSLNRNKRGL